MRVLVLEDQPRLADLLRDCLQQAGYVVDAVNTIATFHTQIRSDSYDVLIVDLGLPDGDGLDAINTYRQRGGILPLSS